MVRQGARKRSVAGCQGWEHTEPCLKPGHAPSTGAERGWVKGYKKGGVGQSRKEGMQTRREEQIVQTIINPVLCVGLKVACHCEAKGGGASKAIPFRSSREGVICLLRVS